MVQQLTLPLSCGSDFNHRDFVVAECNQTAYSAIHNMLLWPSQRMLLLGNAGSGRSHLANIWAQQCGAEIVSASALYKYCYDLPLVVEDIHAILDEEMLFHCINQQQRPMLLTAIPPLIFKLHDLQSRINSCYQVTVKEPSLELLRVLLVKGFSDRQIPVGGEVIDYLCMRMNRSFACAQQLISLLDRASATEKRAITIPFARSVLYPKSL